MGGTSAELGGAGGYLRLLVVSGLIGVPVSLAAFAFLAVLHGAEHGVWVDLPRALGWSSPPWWWPLPCLLAAGLLVGAAVRWLPGHAGHPPIEGISAGRMPTTQLPGALFAALAGLSLGVVLGPEAPLLALGGGLAVLMARPGGIDPVGQQAAIVGVAGTAAALSVVMGSPLVAAVFVMEIAGLAGARLTAVVLPCLACAGIGALVFTGLGSWSGLEGDQLAIDLPDSSARVDVPDLLWTVPVAVAVAVGVGVVHRVGRRVAPWVLRRPLQMIVLAAVAVGGIAAAYALVTGRDPAEVALSGQMTLRVLASDPGGWSAAALVALLLCKGLAYGISLAAFRGGPIFPAVMLGAAAGVLVAPLPGFGVTAAIAAGMAAATAAAIPAPVSAAVLVTLLLGPAAASLTPIVLLAAVVGFVANYAFERWPSRPEPGSREW